ncbi:formate dehydrogenase subunit gamma [Massilia sp. TSP1-1-2]|uniref:formate dehydrogenase subunit gamma n=1 Tax=Massilia sp. TSP1-1-2 TaxID=2804649 RepID=UPI003CF3543E
MRTLLTLICMLLALSAGQAGARGGPSPRDYPEEQTISEHEQNGRNPGPLSAASGQQHVDRHYLGDYGLHERDVILQRGGNTWRLLRNGPLALATGSVLLATPLLIAAFYLLVGPLVVSGAPAGVTLQRFTLWQRLLHWSTALSFLVLAVSGLTIMFGKKLVLPWLGHDAFANVALVSKYLHNLVGPLFILCSVLLFATFARKNMFNHVDWNWLRQAGGLFSKKHVPAEYFNAGEKLWFWCGLTLLGLLMSVTGLVLDFVVFDQTRYVLQVADVLHTGGAALYIAGALGHTYIGTVGVPGAYRAMRHGDVDEQWAKEHHSLWYRAAKGRAAGLGPEPSEREEKP